MCCQQYKILQSKTKIIVTVIVFDLSPFVKGSGTLFSHHSPGTID